MVFFDLVDVTRAWIAPEHLKPYSANKNTFKPFLKDKKYKKRLEAAVSQADDAVKLPLTPRLEKYSFLAQYKGTINAPRRVSKKELKKHQKILKRKFNIRFEESESEDEMPEQKSTKRKNNVIILGTRKKPRERAISMYLERDEIDAKISEAKGITEKTVVPEVKNPEPILVDTEKTETEPNTEASTDTFKKANSLAVQVGSTADSAKGEETFDNGELRLFFPR